MAEEIVARHQTVRRAIELAVVLGLAVALMTFEPLHAATARLPARLAHYAGRISRGASLATVVLFQIALPSEIPGYVLGTVKYSFARYLVALAIAELPYAIGAVYLGDSFVHGNYALLIAIGVAGVLASVVTIRALHRKMYE